MVKVAANMYVKQENTDDFLKVASELVEKTNKLDEGCIKYELCRDKSDALHFMMLEEWKDQASLDKHMDSEHFKTLLPKMDAYRSQPSVLTILEKVF